MGLLNRLLRRNASQNDPIFGALNHHDGQWSGQTAWPGQAEPAALTVLDCSGPPTDAHRATFENLRRDWSALRLDLQGALWGLWDKSISPDFATSIDLWQRLRLQGVNLQADGAVLLIFGFPEETPTDGAFCLTLRGREVVDAEFEA